MAVSATFSYSKENMDDNNDDFSDYCEIDGIDDGDEVNNYNNNNNIDDDWVYDERRYPPKRKFKYKHKTKN